MTHLTKDQMTALLAKARETDPTGRLHLMLLLGWRHALRVTEICTLTVGDLDLSAGYLTVQRLKGSNRTTQPLFPDEQESVKAFVEGKKKTDYLFPGRGRSGHLTRQAVWEQFQRIGPLVGLPIHVCHPHVLKHSCGMTIIKKGIEFTRQYLGHRSISSTGAYLKVTDEEASKAAMVAFGD